MRNKSKANDLMRAFRESRQQVQKPVDKSVHSVDKRSTSTFSRGYTKKSNDPYVTFLDKYNDLENTIDDFKTQDFMYFFREKAKENNIKYVIANRGRDMGVFKKLQENYTPREICLMIEFLFNSDQNYLDKEVTQPTVLISSWCNTLYRDSLLWADDEYKPYEKPNTRKEQISKREWKREVKGEKSTIGEWE